MKRYHKHRLDKQSTHVKQTFNQPNENALQLMIITDAALVDNGSVDPAVSKYIWRYQVTPAKITWNGLGNLPVPAARTTAGGAPPNFAAFSISELGNTANVFSYGVPISDLPTGIVPVRIPNGTPVLCWASFRLYNNGNQHYLIINTQAITGDCGA
jgi:hypothetical protein